jgi:hypothetical protein
MEALEISIAVLSSDMLWAWFDVHQLVVVGV